MPPIQPWPLMAIGWEDSESSIGSNQTVESFHSSRRPIIIEGRPHYPANPTYVDTRRRFTRPSTFETGQHSGVALLDPPERKPQQSQQEQQPEQMGEEDEQGQEWEKRV